MKKNNVKKTGRIVRSCFAAMLAVVMAIPVAALSNIATAPVSEAIEAEAADVELPEPIMSLDFERGFKQEAVKNGLVVKESKERLMFEEYTDDAGNYVKDPATGKYIAEWTDKPVIMGTGDDSYYQVGVFGNQPTTFDDPEKGNVFRLDNSMEAELIIKTEEDAVTSVPVYTGGFDEEGNPLDEEAAKLSTLQSEHTAHSAVQITNPFVDLDLSEEYERTDDGPVWTKGVTIAYWVKVPTVEAAEGEEVDEDEILNDSVLFTFENIQRDESIDQYTLDPDGEKVTYEVNGYSRYLAIEESKATYGDSWAEEDPLFALGTIETYTDMKSGEEYKVAKDYGPLVRLNPNYEGTSTNKIYFRDDENTKPATVTIEIVEDGKQKKVPLVEIGANLYKSYCTLDTAEGSLIPRGYINGSMQIAASNTFHFKEDDYCQEQSLDENGNIINTPVRGAFDINPNNQEAIGQFRQLRHYNLYYFQGDATVTDAPDEWHYVTCVIQNDWVQFYVDGEEIESDALGYHGEDFNSLNGKKYFNKGFGMRFPYQIGWTNIAEWIKDGTISSGPTNCVPQTMLEWLSNEDTVLYLGYQGVAADTVDQEIGTLDGAMLDDIKFYGVPLSSEQAVALYEQAVEFKDADKNKPLEPIKVLDFESDAAGSIPAGMTEIETNDTSKVNAPKVINEEVFGHILKLDESKTATTGAVKFENPFVGRDDITGITVSYWAKSVANKKGKVSDGVILSFVDEPKVLEHGKIQDAVKNELTRTALYTMLSCDAEFQAGIDTQVYASLKNKYKQSSKKNGNTDKDELNFDQEAYDLEQEWNARVNSMTEWHYVTMVVKNSGISMYLDGVKHENNQQDDQGYTFYGPRFYDGYYNTMYDMFSNIRMGTGNQTATSVMEFITQEDTAAYFGFANKIGSSTTYITTTITGIDDVAFYDKALTDEEVVTIYEAAKTAAASKAPVSGEAVEKLGDSEDAKDEDEKDPDGPKESDDKKTSTFTDNGDGTVSSSANGVTIKADKNSIPEGAILVVNILGAKTSAASYTAANTALKGKGIDVDKMVNTIYDIHLEVDGKVVAPTGKITVTLTPPTGYQAAKTSIVRISDVKSMSTSVSGSSVVFETESLGEFAVMQQKGANASGTNPSTSGSSTAGKTGDTASVIVPVILLAVAFVVVAALRKKEELMED